MSLEFDEAQHEYRLDGIPIPSVTSIIKDVIRYDEKWAHLHQRGIMTEEQLASYAQFGSAVHKACELYLKKSLDEEELDPVLKPALDGFCKFLDETKFKLIQSEEKMYSRELWYAGTLDLYGEIKGKKAVIDIKTGKPAKWHPIQTGAYALLVDEDADRYCLYLGRNESTYKLKKHGKHNDIAFWKNVMNVHNGKARYI